MSLKKDQRGQSLVEVALAMPVLLLVLAGILDVGRAYFTYVALSDAAAEGAAFAAVHPLDTVQIVERAADASNGLVMLEADMVSVIVGDLNPGKPITVAIEYDYNVLTPIIHAFVPGGTITLKSVVSQAIISTDF
jgi:Flp pilus assembly protein TadG